MTETLDLFSEVYYDIETQLSADEVGGWNNVHKMRVSIGVTWCAADGFKEWEEQDARDMIRYMSGFNKVVSFNGDGFDTKVLSAYGDVKAILLRSFDVLVDLKRLLGHRVKLDSVAHATLGVGKSADGLQALRWWKEGKLDLIRQYCRQDVQVLADIVAYGRKNGEVKYDDLQGGFKTVKVRW